VAWLCRQLGVARSGFYAWRQRQQAPGKRAAENAAITAEIQAVFQEHRGFYGSPRIHQELRAAGYPLGRHRVARLMHRAELRARTRKPFRPCSKGSSGAAGVVENLLQQDFQPPAPNHCWAGDITYIRTTAGWRNLAVWIDLFSRRVVG
jgi:transposase InsO family protein